MSAPAALVAPSRRPTRGSDARRAASASSTEQWAWTGADEFTPLGDRVDAPPLPLPAITARRRVVLVRHGQSTWNAEGRIQGSSDFSRLTPKGVQQAETTHEMVRCRCCRCCWGLGAGGWGVAAVLRGQAVALERGRGRWLACHTHTHTHTPPPPSPPPPPPTPPPTTTHARAQLRGEAFGALFVSPLARARQTADIVARGAGLEARVLPALREVDLYSFQGLVKAEGKQRFGAAYASWQAAPADFSIDGRAPVRELWHRGSIAWQTILTAPCGDPQQRQQQQQQQQQGDGDDGSSGGSSEGGGGSAAQRAADCVLVVAHNAVNQALLGTALGLPPRFFRRLLQSNGATSVLDFEPPQGPGAPVRVTVDRLNQSPGPPFKADGGRAAGGRVVIVRHAATAGSADGLLLGSSDEPLSPLGVVQAGRVAELLLDVGVRPRARASMHNALAPTTPARRPLSHCALALAFPQARPQSLSLLTRLSPFHTCAPITKHPDEKVDVLLTSPARRCASTAELIAGLQAAPRPSGSNGGGGGGKDGGKDGGGGGGMPRVLMLPELRNLDVGLWQGQPGGLVRGRPLPPDAEDLGEFWARAGAAWGRALAEAAPRSAVGSRESGGGRTVVVVAHAAVAAALVCHCLGLGPEGLPLFRFSAAGVTVVDLPGGPQEPGVVRTLNYTAHLGRFAPPITPPGDAAEADMCGIEGCF